LVNRYSALKIRQAKIVATIRVGKEMATIELVGVGAIDNNLPPYLVAKDKSAEAISTLAIKLKLSFTIATSKKLN
jgi:hypothetical protein